jgi:hypothetical protein
MIFMGLNSSTCYPPHLPDRNSLANNTFEGKNINDSKKTIQPKNKKGPKSIYYDSLDHSTIYHDDPLKENKRILLESSEKLFNNFYLPTIDLLAQPTFFEHYDPLMDIEEYV